MRVRIWRLDRVVPPINGWAGRWWVGDAVWVSLLGLASVAASPRCAYPRPPEARWPVQYPHRDPSPTDPSYRSGLRRCCGYYALGWLLPCRQNTSRCPQSPFRDPPQISSDKLDRFPRTTAAFTTSTLDGYGLRHPLLARPAPSASSSGSSSSARALATR